MADLYEELTAYCKTDAYPFHMPGHKRRLGCFQNPYSFDITEIDGFDNLHHAEGILLAAEKRASRLYGAEETHFLVNGSTAGILSAIGAVTAQGGRILMSRASHKAAYHAVRIGHLRAQYLETFGSPGFCDCGSPVDPAEVERALREDAAGTEDGGRIRAVYITSPTYDGVVSDVRRIAVIAHRHGIPLIVDEAHGAHFGMHGMFPESSVKLGADIVIHSVHKTLPSLTQTALIHAQGSLVDRRRLRTMLDIYQTSSPSYVLMASIDRCVRMITEHGDELFGRLSRNLGWFYESAADLCHIRCIRTDDPSKILLAPERRTTKELYDALRLRYHLQPEMLSRSYVLMLCAVGDDREGFERLSRALHEIDREDDRRPETDRRGRDGKKEACGRGRGGEKAAGERISGTDSFPEAVLTIGAAADAPQERVPFERAAGRISGEYLYQYPPGIPLITPGERVSRSLLRRVGALTADGYRIEGTDDYSLRTLWCVKEPEEEGEETETEAKDTKTAE